MRYTHVRGTSIKSAGVHLIGVCLRFGFFNLGFWERFPIPPYPFVWGKYITPFSAKCGSGHFLPKFGADFPASLA
jgi:hypothetical protein